MTGYKAAKEKNKGFLYSYLDLSFLDALAGYELNVGVMLLPASWFINHEVDHNLGCSPSTSLQHKSKHTKMKPEADGFSCLWLFLHS